MANRLDAVSPRKGRDGKTYFDKVGVAFENKNGGWSVSLTSYPLQSLNDDGVLECRFLLMPPRDRDDAPPVRGNGGAARRPAAPVDDLSDEVPF